MGTGKALRAGIETLRGKTVSWQWGEKLGRHLLPWPFRGADQYGMVFGYQFPTAAAPEACQAVDMPNWR